MSISSPCYPAFTEIPGRIPRNFHGCQQSQHPRGVSPPPSGKWRAIISRGKRQSKTFKLKADADLWAARVEADIDAIRAGSLPKRSLAEAFDLYAKNESPKKGGAHWEILRLNCWRGASQPKRPDDPALAIMLELSRKQIGDVSTADLARWRDARMKSVTAGTVLRELNLLGAVFTLARKEWKWVKESPLTNLGRPKEPDSRTQRISQADCDAVVAALGGLRADTKSGEVAIAFCLCIETAMRRGEVLSLTWANIRGRVAHLPRTKNGDSRDVPLSKEALRLIDMMRCKNDIAVFTVSNGSADTLFRKAKRLAGVQHIHFHDSRREALTRLAKKFPNPMDLARISGHRDLKILMSVYYRPDVEAWADLLD